MAKVIILTHNEFFDARTKTRFSEHVVTRGGARVLLGVAVVPDDVAKQYYVGHSSFEVQLDEGQLELTPVDEGKTDEGKTDEGKTDEGKTDEPETPVDTDAEAPKVESQIADPDSDEWYTVEQLGKMTVEALKALAASEEIDVSACKLKDEYINVIVAAGQE